MADPAVFVRVGDGAAFERSHFDEGLLDARLHEGEELVREPHSAEVEREAQVRVFGVVFLETAPQLFFG